MRAAPWIAVAFLGCAPEFTDDPTLVTSPRVLAVIAEPAEVRPRATVTLRAVTAPDDARTYAGDEPFRFTFCTVPPRVGDPRPLSDACRTESGVAIEFDGADGDAARGVLPADACARFGPEPPPGDFRPRDPDDTGGFYQPVRVDALGQTWLHLLRIRCSLPDAPADVSREIGEKYVENTNPSASGIEVRRGDDWEPLDALAPGEHVTLRLAWPSDSRETYVALSLDRTRAETRREAMRVSWFTTKGKLAVSVTERAEEEDANDSENEFTAPDDGEVSLWGVLHDSRGGFAVVNQRVRLENR